MSDTIFLKIVETLSQCKDAAIVGSEVAEVRKPAERRRENEMQKKQRNNKTLVKKR